VTTTTPPPCEPEPLAPLAIPRPLPARAILEAAGVGSALLVFVLLTLPRVMTNAVWGDEFRTWRDAINVPYLTILAWRHNPDHAPLGHLLAKLSCDLFGTDAGWAMRLPAWAFGVACLLLAWRLGRAGVGVVGGVLVAWMVAIDFNVTVQSALARMYTMLLAGQLLAMLGVFHALSSPRVSGRAIATIAAGLVLAIWSHAAAATALLGVLSLGVALVVAASIGKAAVQRRAQGLTLLIAAAIALASWTPGLLKIREAGHRDLSGFSRGSDSAVEQFVWSGGKLVGEQAYFLVLGSLVLAGLVITVLRRRWWGAFLWTILVVGYFNLWVASNYRHIEAPRYLTTLQPVGWLGIAMLNVWAYRRFPRPAAATMAVLFVAGVAYQGTRVINDPVHPSARQMEVLAAIAHAEGYDVSRDDTIALPSHFVQYTRYYRLRATREPLERMVDRNAALRRARERGRGRASVPAPQDLPPLWVLMNHPLNPDVEVPVPSPIDHGRLIEVAASERGIEYDASTLSQTPRLILVRVDDAGVRVWDGLDEAARRTSR
jgi:hypothetical protein